MKSKRTFFFFFFAHFYYLLSLCDEFPLLPVSLSLCSTECLCFFDESFVFLEDDHFLTQVGIIPQETRLFGEIMSKECHNFEKDLLPKEYGY